MLACRLHIHTRLWCLNSKRREHLVVLADHGHCHAYDPNEIFFSVERNLALPYLPQFRLESRTVCNGGVGEATQFHALQQATATWRCGERQKQFADGTAVQRHARTYRVVQPQRPLLRLDTVQIYNLAVEQGTDVACLIERMHQPLEDDMRHVVPHRR